jgi:PKD repeat protein
VVRRSLIPALVLLILALGSVDAHADPFTISYEPSNPVAGQTVTFTANRENGNKDADVVWDFDDGTVVETTGRDEPTHIFNTARTYDVKLSVKQSDGTTELHATTPITVAPAPDPPPPPPPANAPPSATFTFAPASPVVGEDVTFTGGSDPDGDLVTRLWDFGDGTTDTGPTPSHAYASAGDYIATLTVTDSHGAPAQTFQSVPVRARSVSEPAPTTGEVGGPKPSFPAPTGIAPAPRTGATGPFPMRPFPVVRIAGAVLPRGALIRILSVRGPRGMQVRVRCRGRSCPVGSASMTSARRLARLHRFERWLAAGTKLELFVRKPGMIGKYTSFLIRAGAPPKRVDLCLFPTRRSPRRCR